MAVKTLNRYVAKKVIKGILLAFLIITSVIMLIDFVELTRNFEKAKGGSLGIWLVLTALNVPSLIEETIPFVVLFGVMGALYNLNKRSELIVMRAAGISAWRFLRPALIVSCVIGIFWSMVLNPLTAVTSDTYDRILASASGQNVTRTGTELSNIWLREGGQNSQRVIHARSADIANYRLNDVTFYIFRTATDGQAIFISRIDADSAVLDETAYWTLNNVIENSAESDFQPADSMSLPASLTRQKLTELTGDIRPASFWKLPAAITESRQAGFSARPLTMKFNLLLALPLLLMAMTVIAASASMRMTRMGGTLRLMLFGGMSGFGVYFIANIMRAFGENGTVPTVLAAWSIPVLVMVFGISYLSKIEDG